MPTDFGTYRLTFEPSADMITPSVEMTLSGEADVNQMLYLFEAFLDASGYVLKGELQVVEREPKPNYDIWGNITAQGSQATDFVPFSSYDFGDDGFSLVGNPVYGATGTDTISFG